MLLWIIAQPPWGEGEKGALTYISRREKQGSAGPAEQRRSLWWAGLYLCSSDMGRTHPGCALAAVTEPVCTSGEHPCDWDCRNLNWEGANELWCLLTCELLGTVTMPVLLNLQSRERSLAACEKIRSLILRNTYFFLYSILVSLIFELHF